MINGLSDGLATCMYYLMDCWSTIPEDDEQAFQMCPWSTAAEVQNSSISWFEVMYSGSLELTSLIHHQPLFPLEA